MDRPISKTRLLEIASNPSSDKYEDDIGQLVSWGLYQGLLDCDGFDHNQSILCNTAASRRLRDVSIPSPRRHRAGIR